MAQSNPTDGITSQIRWVIHHLISEQNRDPHTPAYGCFDRRYWGWKLADFPEATFQRNVYPFALLYDDAQSDFFRNPNLREGIISGLKYAATIQHKDGSFDQAFPNEHSFGATAFLLHDLLEAYRVVREDISDDIQKCIENCLFRASEFLCSHGEHHGLISNHIAGAALSLFVSADYFQEDHFRECGESFAQVVLQYQSREGWFIEYAGADPGYQTLCIYYLSKIFRLWPTDELEDALKRAIEFVSFFAHPDGTFGGEYGSRRTSIYYPGGMAILKGHFSLADHLNREMFMSVGRGTTVNLVSVDIGNMAPLLSNYICALQAGEDNVNPDPTPLPWETSNICKDFPDAGIFIRSTDYLYSILGVSNGGVLKVFDRNSGKALWDDGGYICALGNGKWITTQITDLKNESTIAARDIELSSDFYCVLHSMPTPFRFLLLRLLNLTVMRSTWLGDIVKKRLVKLLVSGKQKQAMWLERRVSFLDKKVVVRDYLRKSEKLHLESVEYGRRFNGIHMASAGYYDGVQTSEVPTIPKVDVEHLNRTHSCEVSVVIEASDA